MNWYVTSVEKGAFLPSFVNLLIFNPQLCRRHSFFYNIILLAVELLVWLKNTMELYRNQFH